MFLHMIHKGHILRWIDMLSGTYASCLYKLLWIVKIANLSEPNCTVSCSNKMLQRLAVTNPKNDKMDPHGVNPTLSIFLQTPFPVAMQGLGATAPWEKDLRIPCLEIIVFTNWKTGIGLSKECYQKWYARLSCLEFIVLTKWKTGIGLSKRVLSKNNTRF